MRLLYFDGIYSHLIRILIWIPLGIKSTNPLVLYPSNEGSVQWILKWVMSNSAILFETQMADKLCFQYYF